MCGDIIILGDNMLCLICNNEFEQKHFNQKYCSENCKHKAKRISQDKYKKTEKGKISNQKWINSDRRKENEKRYRQNPIARHKAVLRTMKYLENSEYGKEQKRLRDLRYSQSDKGKEANRKATRKYRKTEKGKLNNRKQKYIRRSMTPIDTETIKEILSGDYCYYCKNKITGIKTIDHKIPVIKGGTNNKENLVLCCKHCNSQKNNKTEEEYREWLKSNALKQEK
jgi:5-methylcytosine-specific restriction endonuclease McrA